MSVYALSDLHGNLNIWKKIKEFLKPEDKVYFLGDAADRGDYGWEIIKEIIKDNRFIYIKGNHEDMLINALCSNDPYHIQLCSINGGFNTYTNALNDSWCNEYVRRLKKLKLYDIYKNKYDKTIFMSHSGSTDINNENDLLWNRNFSDDVNIDYDYIIHGHTPIEIMRKKFDIKGIKYTINNESIQYGNKINIDIGTAWTNKALLVDLDNLNVIIIK